MTKKSAPFALMEEEELAEALTLLCAKDDAAGLKKLISEQGIHPTQEISHSRYLIEFAYEADAVACFEAIDARARANGSKTGAIGLRLWGGQTPPMRCCYHSDSEERNAKGAPKCLAWVLEREPLIALRADEEGRSCLDWAAMCPQAAPFEMLMASLVHAKESADLKPEAAEAIKQAASKSVFYAAGNCDDEKLCLARMESLSQLGIDWRSLRSNHIDWKGERKVGDGQCLLGAAIEGLKGSNRASSRIVLALLAAGADPMSLYAKEESRYSKDQPGPAAPLASLFLDPLGGMSFSREASAIAKPLFDALKDEDLLKIGNQAMADSSTGSLAESMGRFFKLGERLPAMVDVCARHAALREIPQLEEAAAPAGPPKKRKVPGL